jgi:hypothetical protein
LAAFPNCRSSSRPPAWTLICLGAIRDLIVERRVHKVYLYALPILIVCQVAAMETFVHASPWWMNVANRILR